MSEAAGNNIMNGTFQTNLKKIKCKSLKKIILQTLDRIRKYHLNVSVSWIKSKAYNITVRDDARKQGLTLTPANINTLIVVFSKRHLK